MKSKGMVVFTTPFSVTLGGIRTEDNFANTFNDYLFSSYFDEKGNIVSVIVNGTVDSGLYYRINPANKLGTAIIQHDKQYRGVYQFQDPNKNKGQLGHKGQRAFRQIKAMDYWRDNNKDSKLDYTGETETSIAYTNGHYMGTVGNLVNNWSAGCWGSTVDNMEKLYAHAELQISKGLKDIFSFALLHEKDF